jgi:hypothetical protein
MEAAAPPHPGDDLIGYLTRYPHELTFGEEDPAAVFDRYHADDFVLRNDGSPWTEGGCWRTSRSGAARPRGSTSRCTMR